MGPRKIVHVTTIDQSLDYLLLNQLQKLKQGGHDVYGIATPGPHVATIEAAGIKFLPVAMTRNFTPFADLVSLWRLWRVMRRERFTIVHTHNPKPALLGQLAARLAGVPIVVNTLHGFYFHDNMHPAWRRFYILMERIAARCSDMILSENTEDMQTALREGICRATRIKHLGSGIVLSTFDPKAIADDEVLRRRQELGIAPDAPVVGFVGRLAAKRKGFLDFLEAGRRVAEQLPNVRFLIVGEPDYGKPDAVEPAVAAEYGIADRCLFLGRQPNATLPVLYRVMDLLVLPSLFEGLPQVVMEASAMGVPAVVTDVKGNREAVEDGRNGLLVPLGDVDRLTAAILEVLTDPQKARRMSEEGRRIALERFDEQDVIARVEAEYASLLRRKQPSRHEQVSASDS